MFGQADKIARGKIPADAEWNRMVAKAAGARPWVVYGLLAIAAVLGVRQTYLALQRERETLLARQRDAMEMMSLSIESPYHAGIDHVMLAVNRLFAQGLLFKDFSLPPSGVDEPARPRLVEPEKMLREKSLYERSLLPRCGMFNVSGEPLAGVFPPGMTATALRAEFEPLKKPGKGDCLVRMQSPRYEEEGKRWVVDAVAMLADHRPAWVGGFVFQLDQRHLRAWGRPDSRGPAGRRTRSLILHAKTHRVCSSVAAKAFEENLPDVGDVFVSPELEAALASGKSDKNGVIFFSTSASGAMPPLLCRLATSRDSRGYLVLVQSDEDEVLAPWREARHHAAAVGAALFLFAAFAVALDSRRRRLRGELAVMRTELAVRRRQEEDMTRLNVELEARVEARTAELSAVNSELAEANRELDAYARTVTHDLRAPIRSIRSFADILVEDHAAVLPPEARVLVEKIRTKAGRMTELVEAIFRLARSAHAKPGRLRVNLSEMAGDIVAALCEAEPSRRVVFHVAPGCVANADPELTRIVLENLLGNAWKYSSKSPETVIGFGCETRDGVSMFYVRDKGVGFDDAQADRLFRPFSRLHTAERFDGAGIGLATVARIVRLHGGEIVAEGRPGEGAVFRFTLTPAEREA